MQKIIVTGVNGFVGHHLSRELSQRGWEVIGVGYDEMASPDLNNTLHKYIRCDLTDQSDVNNLPLTDVRAIINLAGLADVGKSFDEPNLYMNVNVKVLSTICSRLQVLRKKNLRVIAVSTGALYASDQPMPLTEDSILSEESSPYAASKLAMEQAAKDFRDKGYDCVIVRPFNHIGPGQIAGFLLPDLFAKIKAGDSEIKVGNLETKRDYTDVRDVVRAYADLVSKDKLDHAAYNVCSGVPVSGMQILEILKRVMGRDDLKIEVDKDLFRPSDAPILYGDNTRLKEATGWSPTISLDQTIKDFVEIN